MPCWPTEPVINVPEKEMLYRCSKDTDCTIFCCSPSVFSMNAYSSESFFYSSELEQPFRL